MKSRIDKHFLSAGLSEKGKIVLEEMFHLLKRTDKWIVCEGVETKEMVDFLISEDATSCRDSIIITDGTEKI